MGAPTLAGIVNDVARAFPNRAIDEAQYRRDLADVPFTTLTETVREILRTSREWPPSVGDIREASAARILGIPDERAAVRQIDQRVAWVRAGSTGEAPALHPLVRESVHHVGGWHSLRVAERPEVIRGQMMRYYRESRQAELRAAAAKNMDALTPA